MHFPVYGTATSKLLIIGDAPFGVERLSAGSRPFSSSACQILPVALNRYGMPFVSCAATYLLDTPAGGFAENFMTTVKKHGREKNWPEIGGVFISPDLLAARERVLQLIDDLAPNCVLLCGDLALWAVTGQAKLGTCRGSIYPSVPTPSGRVYKTVCTLSPASVHRQWEMHVFFERDIQRAVLETRTPGYHEPAWNFHFADTAEGFCEKLEGLISRADTSPIPVKLACDIETIRHEIACVGIAWSPRDAICVPFRTKMDFWTLDEELRLILTFKRLLEHPNVRIIGQNFHYDAQYFTTKWGVIPRVSDDTMVAQHLLFPSLPKALYVIASVYCDFYQYWKDDLKDYRKAPEDDAKFLKYNCRDCCYTFEAMTALSSLLTSDAVRGPLYAERMTRLWWTTLRLMLRGVRVNTAQRQKLAVELMDAASQRQEFLNYVTGQNFNPRSSPQMKDFFYNQMGVKPEKSRVRKVESLDSEILQKIPDTYPLLGPIVDTIIEQRSIGVFLKNFVQSELDADGRMRCSFNMCGTETFRYASSENAFGRGGNQQNIPKGDRARTRFKMPNIRNLYLPDVGYEIFDIDLAGADAQVVAWESGDANMKALFREKRKIAAFAAKEIFGSAAGSDGKNEPYYTRAKMGGHATNYGAYPGTVAKACGISFRDAEKFQELWFSIFPGIRDWHTRIEHELQTRRYVENRFGYRMTFFGRVDKALPQALAWVPQSTVAIVTAKAMDILDLSFPSVEILLQVHDSIVGQLPIERPLFLFDQLLDAVRIPIPYDDPLTIPWGAKLSKYTWGDCE